MKRLKFIRCGSNTFSRIKNFVIENSTFEGQYSSSTALKILETDLKVKNSSFSPIGLVVATVF